MVIIHPRLILLMAALLAALFLLVKRYDPRSPHGRALQCCTLGLALLLAWNALPLPRIGMNLLAAWTAGALGLPGVGLLAVLAKLP